MSREACGYMSNALKPSWLCNEALIISLEVGKNHHLLLSPRGENFLEGYMRLCC